MNEPKITIGHLQKCISQAVKLNKLNDETQISYILQVMESNQQFLKNLKFDAPLGSIVFGIEWYDEDGYLCYGTMLIQPEPTKEPLN